MRVPTLLLAVALTGARLGAQRGDTTMSLTLQQALLRAEAASPAVGIARAGISSAQASWLRARSGYLPQINGSATYTRTLASEFSGFANSTPSDTFPTPANCIHYVPDPTLSTEARLAALERGLDCAANGSSLDLSQLPFGRPNTYTFSLSGSQTLFDRRIGGQLASANASRDQARVEFDAQRAGAVVTVTQAYFDAQLAQRLVDIADSTLAQAQRTFDQTRLERQAGNAAEFDQLRASVARDNQTPVLLQRRAARDQALLRLHQVLDVPASTRITLATPLADTTAVALPPFAAAIAGAADTAIDARAPVREAAAAVRAGEGTLRAARSERLPTVGVASTYSKIDFPQQVFSFDRFLTDWSVSVTATVPIFNGGRLRADALAAEAALEQSQYRLTQARQQAQLELGDASTQLSSAQATFSASIGTVAQAQRAYDIAELRYQNGLSTLTDVGDARLQLGQAQANNAQAARDLQVARMRIALLRDLPFNAGTATAGFGASAGQNGSTGSNPGPGQSTQTTAPVNSANPFVTAPRTSGNSGGN
jgi:outer membrane protein